jgi:hypothetical protein
MRDANVNLPGPKRALPTVKTAADSDQTEAHNVTKDPLELVNLVHSTDPAVQATISQLETLLHQQCEAKGHPAACPRLTALLPRDLWPL